MNHEVNASTDSLNEAPPNCSAEFARDLLHRIYGIDGQASQLACERDQIFKVKTESGDGFVLRLTNPAEDRQVTNFQTEAMVHLNKMAPDLPVPRVIRDENGDAEIEVILPDDRLSIARLITLLPGVALATVPERNPAVRASMADHIAKMGFALRSFFHPAANHELLWDMKHALKLRELLPYLQDEDTRSLVEKGLDAFEHNVAPIQSSLRAQVIHNDFNFSNVMIDEHQPEITGVLDFGDMVYAPLIYDLAVALAYQFSGDDDDAPGIITEFTHRYHRIIPLQRQELELLYDLITTRQVLSLLIGHWRASLYPGNRQYILRNSTFSRVGIERLAALDRDEVTQALVDCCSS
ncbi:MAG: phosphotransferase [Gammaproteobacteria bacterium]|nr:phosphotransferase [Gammaproteobacteria bacterium]